MSDVTIGRGPGRPDGTDKYGAEDRAWYPIIIAMLKPTPVVRYLRDALNIVTKGGELLAGAGTDHSKIRRVETRYREDVST